MKKIICMVFLILPFVVHSQDFKKVFFAILDEYIEREPLRKGFEKDSILLLVSVTKINKVKDNYLIGISMYIYEDYPVVDSLTTYKGVKTLVSFSRDKEELSKCFKSIEDNRKIKDEEDISRFESTRNFAFQVNKNNEIYFIITSKFDDKYYYKKLKKKGLKFSKDLKFTKDMYKKQN